MKVLFLTHYSTLYGANRSMLGLAEDMINRYGLDVFIICPKKGPIVDAARKIGAHVFVLQFYAWQTERFLYAKSLLRCVVNPFLYKKIKGLVNNISPDIIHSNSSLVDLGVILSEDLNIPCVWHLREFGHEDYNLKYLVPYTSIPQYYKKAETLIAVSENLKNSYEAKFPGLSIERVYNGVTPINVEKKRQCACNFCIVGRITEKKGIMDILMAVNELVQRCKTNFHLYIIGEGKKNYIKKLRTYISNNNLDNFITFCGYSNKIEENLGFMDVGIMASELEAFGRVTVEYMYAELFIISTDKGGTKEIIGDEAAYYEFGDYTMLSQLMQYCIDHLALIREKGEGLKRILGDRYEQRRCTDNIMAIYDRIIDIK